METRSRKNIIERNTDGENGDLNLECVDEEQTVNQTQSIKEASKALAAIENQILVLVAKLTNSEDSVELSVANKDGFKVLYSKFVKSGDTLNSAPALRSVVPAATAVNKAQVVPRIQSVTSLAPKVLQQPVIRPTANVTYRMIPVLNQNTNRLPTSTQNVDYHIMVPTQQTLMQPLNQQVILPTAQLVLPTANATTTQVKVTNTTSTVVNKPKTQVSRTQPNVVSSLQVSDKVVSLEDLKDDSGNSLDLTYYGSKQGNLSFGQSRGNFTFKCGQCQQILPSNLVYMKHIREHFEAYRVKNNYSSNLDCEYCFKAFPFVKDLESHKEKVHFNSVYKCKFCEYSFADKTTLIAHLSKKHTPLQMPYVCKLCGYMTSIYQDILKHFEKRHDRTKFVQCHLCLKVMADVRNFFKHCQTHYQSSNLSKGHCRMCKLIFLNSQDFRDHTEKDHVIHSLSNRTPVYCKPTSKRQLPQIPSQSTNYSPAKKLKTGQPNPPVPQSAPLSFAKCIPEFQGPLRCCECGARANVQNHFRKHILQCKICRYRTFCQRSYSSHSTIFHSSQRSPPVLHPVRKTFNRNKTVTLTCQRCFFTTQSASFMAWHVVICPKGSSIVESFCYRKNTAGASQPKKAVIPNNDDPIVIDDSDDESGKTKHTVSTTSKDVAVNGVH